MVAHRAHNPKVRGSNPFPAKIFYNIYMKEENRHPVVTFVGHVNHGKTTLIEKLCKTSIVDNEIGKITQNIETYYTTTTYGKLTILDTPGHDAFLNMKLRGIKCTDIVILVIAADDGITEQIKEIISYIKNEKLPLIIVINKIDKSTKNIEKIISELSKYNVIDEKWGGDTFFVQTSAKLNIGIEKLIETIYLQAEFLELKKNEKSNAEGIIIETQTDKGYGKLTNIILFKGKLKKKDLIKIENNYEQIKLILNLEKKEINELDAAIPAYIVGLHSLPKSGETLYKVENNKNVKKNIFTKKTQNKNSIKTTTTIITNKMLSIMIKSKTFGSADAIADAITKLQFNSELKIDIKNISTGDICESDIKNAIIFNSIIIGHNVSCKENLKKLAQKNNVILKIYNIIYDLLNDIENMLKEQNKKNDKQNTIVGTAIIKSIFILSNKETIFGCNVLTGIIKIHDTVEIKRKDLIITKTTIKSLQCFKNKVKEIKKGEDCGIGLTHYKEDIYVDDTFIVYKKN